MIRRTLTRIRAWRARIRWERASEQAARTRVALAILASFDDWPTHERYDRP